MTYPSLNQRTTLIEIVLEKLEVECPLTCDKSNIQVAV